MNKFKIGDVVYYTNAKNDIHKGKLKVIGLPQPGIDGNSNYRVEQLEYTHWGFYLPEHVMELAETKEGENFMCRNLEKVETAVDEAVKGSGTATEAAAKEAEIAKAEANKKVEAKPDHGRFYLDLGVREFFSTKEELEHYIKEHAPISFEMKSDLLTKGEGEKYTTDDDGDPVLMMVKAGELETK